MTLPIKPANMPQSFSATVKMDATHDKIATIALICAPEAKALICNGVDMQVKSGTKNTTLHVEQNGRITITEIDGKSITESKEVRNKDFAALLLNGAKVIVASTSVGDGVRVQQTADLIQNAVTKFTPPKTDTRSR